MKETVATPFARAGLMEAVSEATAPPPSELFAAYQQAAGKGILKVKKRTHPRTHAPTHPRAHAQTIQSHTHTHAPMLLGARQRGFIHPVGVLVGRYRAFFMFGLVGICVGS